MVTKTIKFKIPDSIYRYRWSNIVKYVKWLWKPNRCSVCGDIMNYRHPEIVWKSPDNVRVMVHYDIIGDYTGCVCSSCLEKVITDENARSKNTKADEPVNEHDTKQVCDCCGEQKISYKWASFKLNDGRRVGIISGREWWNGFYFCADCLRSAVKNGRQGSGIHVGHVGPDGKYKSYPQNNFGLPVVDGKVKFPW